MNNALDRLVDAIRVIDEEVPDSRSGLPLELFLCVSRLMPLTNVDLLIVDELDRKLLTWREDQFFGPGWHIPGGIIRFKERATERITAVALTELGASVMHDPTPCEVIELMNPQRDVRGHCVSLLYRCRLMSPLDESKRADPDAPRDGQWAWFAGFPENMIKQHYVFRHHFSDAVNKEVKP